MAKFLNDPNPIGILDTKFAVTTTPLLFQYAGSPVPQELVQDYLNQWQEKGAYQEFLSKLPPDVQIWWVPPGKITDGPSMPGYLACTLIVALIGWITSLLGNYAPELAVVVGGLIGSIVRAYMKPEDFYLPGVLHDDLQVKFSTGNATTDGFLRDAVTAEISWVLRSYLIYIGVRFGTIIGYKTKISDKIQKEALTRYSRIRQVESSDLWFDHEHSEIRYIIKDPIQSLS